MHKCVYERPLDAKLLLMINELAIHMSHCFGMIKLGIIYLLPKYFDYNPLNIILKRLI